MPSAPFDCAQTDAGLRSFFDQIANGNAEAVEFLCLWMAYAHAVDDIIDEQKWSYEEVLATLVLASMVFSHPFYRANVHRLQTPVLLATSTYGDSVKWEKDPALWKRQWAEVTRHAGNDVILSVALICGGYDHLRRMSAALYATCFVYHADKYGIPK